MTSPGQMAVKGLAAGIGLISESISAHKARKQLSKNNTTDSTGLRASSEGNGHPQNHNECLEAPERGTIDSLEAQWELDETQDELEHAQGRQTELPEYSEGEQAVEEAVHRFASDYPPPVYTPSDATPTPQLRAPILLPQRRPKSRKRGFIRAYAPDLAAFSIDQPMFLEFLDTAEKACQGARWLNAINLASIGTMFMPTATGIAVSVAIQIATEVAIAVDGIRKTNTFFDKMNREFFQPRGLFCLVMTWNPELPDAPSTTVDLNSMVFKSTERGGSDMMGRLRHKFKSSDGKTYGNIFPEVAPLIFPGLDELASDQDAQKKISKTKKKMEFVNSYWDKRAQAQFATKNPESHLSQGPKATFTSRYADPNHPASSGDLLALVSGGHFSTEKLQSLRGGRSPLGRTRGSDSYADQDYDRRNDSRSNPPAPYGRSFGSREDYDQRDDSRSNPPAPHAPYGGSFGLRERVGGMRDARGSRGIGHRGSFESSGYDMGRGENGRMLDRRAVRGVVDNVGLGSIAKLREQKVLYLAIVNMPSEAELAQVRDIVGRMDV